MGTKTVTKALAGVEDCLMGSETRTQVRAGQNVQVTGLSGDGIPLNTALGGSIGKAISDLQAEVDDNNDAIADVLSRTSKNFIINGNFDVWQRGTSTSVGGLYHAADRWSNWDRGGSFLASQQTFSVGQTDVPGNPRYYQRVTHTAGNATDDLNILGQPIEAASAGAGATITLSFWAKADTPLTISTEFEQTFGDTGTPPPVASIGITKHNLTTSWQKYSATVAVPTLDPGLVYDPVNSFLGLFFWMSAGSDYDSRTGGIGNQSGTIDISQVQVVLGDVATDYPAESQAEVLAACKRYYQQGKALLKGYTTAGIDVGYRQAVPVTLRVVPEIQDEVTISGVNVSGEAITANLDSSIVLSATGVTSGQFDLEMSYSLYAEIGPAPIPA